jgi:hypothetical protein
MNNNQHQLGKNNLEKKINDIGKTCYNTLKESSLIAKRYGSNYLGGLLGIPYITLTNPSFRADYKRAAVKNEQLIEKDGELIPFRDTLKTSDYVTTILGVLTFVSCAINQYQSVKEYVIEHPYTLAIPIITNLLSAGYERQKENKNKR